MRGIKKSKGNRMAAKGKRSGDNQIARVIQREWQGIRKQAQEGNGTRNGRWQGRE